MSIIKQKEVNIDKIILTLDKNKWTPENIPWIIKRLLKLGIDILFVDDIKSYTKIIPVLSLYKNSSIVSVDDDIYYSSNLIKTLYNGHLLFPDKIIAVKALIPEIKQNKIAASYIFWKEAIYGYTVSYIMPLGVRGVLYPPGAFVEEVFNQSVFMKLAPTNDDLWLWIMALVSKTKHHLIDSKDINVYPFDAFYQLLRKDSALFKINHKGTTNKTDEQLQALMDYCKLSLPYIE
jgi:hypothetical protein